MRNSTRWIAVGAISSTDAAAAPTSAAKYVPRWKPVMSSKRDENGTVSRNANRTCTPVWTTRTSCRSSMRLRSRRSVSVSSRRRSGASARPADPSGSGSVEGGAPAPIALPALDPRAGDDVVAAVRPADPRFVAAVVVVAEQHQGRLLPERGARLVALGIDAAPDADEGVALPLGGDGRRLGVAGPDDGLRRERHERVHDRAAEVLVARRAGRAHAADRVLEQRVAGEDVALDEQREHALRVAGRVERRHLEVADAHGLAGGHRAGHPVDRLVRMGEDLHVGPALREL